MEPDEAPRRMVSCGKTCRSIPITVLLEPWPIQPPTSTSLGIYFPDNASLQEFCNLILLRIQFNIMDFQQPTPGYYLIKKYRSTGTSSQHKVNLARRGCEWFWNVSLSFWGPSSKVHLFSLIRLLDCLIDGWLDCLIDWIRV